MNESRPSQPLRIVALSHLAWERNLFQRPQQLMTQFARLGDEVVYFALVGFRRYMTMRLQERIYTAKKATLLAQNLPFMPFTKRAEFPRKVTMSLLRAKARPHLANDAEGRRVLWLQNPAYVDEIDRLPHDLVVYDVMDPFKSFRSSDPRVEERERKVLEKADLVFTGGRSLHSQVEGKHNEAFCFPSGIDFHHFARGAEEGEIPRDLEKIEGPRLGYFGAVDERIDWDLISEVCRKRRHWQIVFLGPLVLIDRIPISEPNFHWLGPKSYDLLPAYLRGFDVCLIPWLVNELTRFMSPTKTPEYLAAGRPVVSTPIPDVAQDYRDEAYIAETPESFIDQCARALTAGTGSARKPEQSRTWEETARDMHETICRKLAK